MMMLARYGNNWQRAGTLAAIHTFVAQPGVTDMATRATTFFAGVGTTIVILAAGFGGGLMMARTTLEPNVAASGRSVTDRLPPARVVLSASAEAATPREAQVAAVPVPEAAPPAPLLVQTHDVQATVEKEKEKDKQAERAERRKAEADERERRKRVAARRATREAARMAKQQEQQQRPQQPGIMAFDDAQPRAGFSGN